MNNSIVPIDSIGELIHLIRGQKVLFDSDLAQLYEADTRTSNQAVKRHKESFPEDFMFQLTQEEFSRLRSQSVISPCTGQGENAFCF